MTLPRRPVRSLKMTAAPASLNDPFIATSLSPLNFMVHTWLDFQHIVFTVGLLTGVSCHDSVSEPETMIPRWVAR